ncbi:hypothetical protein WP3W18E01_24360 [Raoultella ornithinolytica]|uniref:hypothetical protein n=1 Tax=Klebsiella/Raoultella group TaxID=2890311 RepID=UPI0006504D45|nr:MULTISPECIES: hypothetical protein [Klebsiella/Raoultella group]KMI13234.1 hypothetical protein SM85_03257 [Klebsiella variicola]QLK21531.1 hypothetical protein GPJ66_12385 [Raoultella ornithinolytica]WPO25475.1 hypothetical protein SH582_06015 [Raoultella ornithinolytica]BBQ78468.1 hypothetical protein WP3W18E01_24360 [Raoultella ornithinolytica]
MTTDITELAQREKFEAWFVNDVVGADVNFPAFKDGEYAEGEIYDEQLYFMLQAMWMAWKAANAELVEALEKAQGMEAYWKTQCRGITDHCEELQARIAELESRTVKLPKKNIGWDRDEDDCWNNAIDACAESLTAAGIKVEAE